MRTETEFSIDAASALSQGARQRQEDALALAFPRGADMGFAVLSDGMGGHAAGDLASRLIVSEVFSELTVRSRDAAQRTLDVPMLLQHAVHVANDSLSAHVMASPTNKGMGGTVVALIIEGGHLFWVSVGDSMLFLLRNGELQRLNDDHSMAPQLDLLVEKGLMEAEAAKTHPQRSCLTSAVLGEDIAEIDCPSAPLDLMPGDVVIVASDGLQFIDDKTISATLSRVQGQSSAEITDALTQAVAEIDHPHQDNLSIIVLRAEEQARPLEAAHWPAPTAILKACGRALLPRGAFNRGLGS